MASPKLQVVPIETENLVRKCLKSAVDQQGEFREVLVIARDSDRQLIGLTSGIDRHVAVGMCMDLVRMFLDSGSIFIPDEEDAS